MDEKIEQLAKDLKLIKELQASDIYTANYQEAKALFSLGYRKESDTAREIFKWLKSEVIMTEIPHGSEPCEEDVEAVMWWQIEEHFKKKYGVEVE